MPPSPRDKPVRHTIDLHQMVAALDRRHHSQRPTGDVDPALVAAEPGDDQTSTLDIVDDHAVPAAPGAPDHGHVVVAAVAQLDLPADLRRDVGAPAPRRGEQLRLGSMRWPSS